MKRIGENTRGWQFALAPNGNLMARPIRRRGSRVTVGAWSQGWDVIPYGQRFTEAEAEAYVKTVETARI